MSNTPTAFPNARLNSRKFFVAMGMTSRSPLLPPVPFYDFNQVLFPDTEEGDRAFHDFYLAVCKENSRRAQRACNKKMQGRK